ncbi:MAG: SURF1 family protein [Methylococcaceae bacterium]|nr:SURF1 family protein [Methylococcaceae bacterium]
MNITILKRQFRFSPLGLSLYVLLLALLCSLGFWQLGRAEQKRQFLQQQQTAAETAVLDLNRQPIGDVESARYQKVLVSGRYDATHQFLIDNQILDGKPGYFVMTPFLLDQGKIAVLVNRGWVPLGADRKALPDVDIKTEVKRISGRINQFPPVGIKLKGAEIPTDGWPALVQVIDSRVLAARLAYDLYDFQIELDGEADEGYRRQWKSGSTIPPEKHLAYAVQWFGLALTLTGLFIWISSRKRSEHTA